MVYTRTIEVVTHKNKEIIDITSRVDEVVAGSGIGEGLALVFTMHTTTGLYLNEREGGLVDDVEKVLCALVPDRGSYRHDRVDNNAASHIQSVLLSPSLTLPVTRGSMELGTWQSVLFAERDGPRRRSVMVKVVGE
ncbi:MAG: secondary thiamine-phosphate synthase enzyme YjbQ [bacterium]|jgi:secondary thiamine-phosphate synthase enzyme